MTIRRLPLALAAAAIFAVPAAAVAAEAESTTAGVQYKDLDLTTEAGQKELERRLDRAARAVCGMDDRTVGSRLVSRESRNCYRDAHKQLGDQITRLTQGKAEG